MKTMNVTVSLATALALVLCGCRARMAPFTDYLSDYVEADTAFGYELSLWATGEALRLYPIHY